MSMMVSFVLSFFPRDVLDEILNLIESVSEDFPSYFYLLFTWLSTNSDCLKEQSCIGLHYIPINNRTFELLVFWPSDTESRIKLMFSEFISLSFKMRLGLNATLIYIP